MTMSAAATFPATLLGEREPDAPVRKIGLVGFTASKADAPFGDPEWELWGLNNLHRQIEARGFRRWYDLHPDKMILGDSEHEGWLRAGAEGLPVYVWNPKPEWPTSVAFPLKELTDQFGRYFTNSISYMIAHAIAEGATHLGLWGVDMAQGTEYAAQRPSCEYFLGVATGLGITVEIADTSDLLKSAGLYGEGDDSGLRAKLEARIAELQELKRQADQQKAHGEALWHQAQGGIENLSYILGVWTQPQVKRTT